MALSQSVVVIVATASDSHALAVAAVLERDFGVSAIIWDTERMAQDEQLSFSIGPDRVFARLGRADLDFSSVRSVWWRRPNGFGIQHLGLARDVADFCQREYRSLLYGALETMPTLLVNSPSAEAVAQRKPVQLSMARACGLAVPDTVITNDPSVALTFWEKHNRECVYKTLTPTPGTFRETRPLTEVDLSDLAALAMAPIIVQQRLTGLDLRVTLVGDRQFAAVVRPGLVEAATDWRLDLSCQWELYELDGDLCSRLRKLRTALGLHYGCVDLRLAADGTPHFLEINPSGQFLFVQVDTGQPIVEAMCALLVDPSAAMPKL